MAKKGLNDQQKRALLVIGIVAMIIIIGVIAVQVTRQEEAIVKVPKEEVPESVLPSPEVEEEGAVNILELLNPEYWSGGIGESINGTITAVDPDSGIVIFTADTDGKLYYTRITDMTDTYVGEAPASLADFKEGMPITVSYEPYYVEV